MRGLFNKTFLRFLFSFIGVLAGSFVVILIVGYLHFHFTVADAVSTLGILFSSE